MGTPGSRTWPHQALMTMLHSSPAMPAPPDMDTLATLGTEPAMASRPAMPAPPDMDILATLGTELAMVVLTVLDMLAMVVLTELDMLAMVVLTELDTDMATLATPATAASLPTGVDMVDIES